MQKIIKNQNNNNNNNNFFYVKFFIELDKEKDEKYSDCPVFSAFSQILHI
jgi:hypothetical protein